jgi:hypothetical protein
LAVRLAALAMNLTAVAVDLLLWYINFKYSIAIPRFWLYYVRIFSRL